MHPLKAPVTAGGTDPLQSIRDAMAANYIRFNDADWQKLRAPLVENFTTAYTSGSRTLGTRNTIEQTIRRTLEQSFTAAGITHETLAPAAAAAPPSAPAAAAQPPAAPPRAGLGGRVIPAADQRTGKQIERIRQGGRELETTLKRMGGEGASISPETSDLLAMTGSTRGAMLGALSRDPALRGVPLEELAKRATALRNMLAGQHPDATDQGLNEFIERFADRRTGAGLPREEVLRILAEMPDRLPRIAQNIDSTPPTVLEKDKSPAELLEKIQSALRPAAVVPPAQAPASAPTGSPPGGPAAGSRGDGATPQPSGKGPVYYNT